MTEGLGQRQRCLFPADQATFADRSGNGTVIFNLGRAILRVWREQRTETCGSYVIYGSEKVDERGNARKTAEWRLK